MMLLTITILIQGCKKDLLEPINQNAATAETYYTNEDNLKKAVWGIYKQLLHDGDYQAKGLYGATMWCFADGAADLIDTRTFNADGFDPLSFQRGVQSPDNQILNTLWYRNYRIVRRANDVVGNIEKVTLTNGLQLSTRNQYLGEALFLRALANFNIVRAFGGRPHVAAEDEWGVPLISKALSSLNDVQDSTLKKRAKVSEVYTQIISDLKTASGYLPISWDGNNIGRSTKGAAFGLLAKVYMTKAGTLGDVNKDWTNANIYCDSVINLNIYHLWTDPGVLNNAYGTLFRRIASNSSESLFEVQCTPLSSGDGSVEYGFGENYNNFLAISWDMAMNNKGVGNPTQDFINMYEGVDQRLSASVFISNDTWLPDFTTQLFANGDGTVWHYDPLAASPSPSLTGYNVKKYLSGQKGGRSQWETGPANPRVLRYAETLLIKAEALNEIGNTSTSVPYIDMIRNRAGLPSLATNLSQAVIRQTIWDERAKELFMEADRWFDLKRTDMLLVVMIKKNNNLPRSLNDPAKSDTPYSANFTTNRNYVMPIPQGDIDVCQGTLKQYPGY